MLSFLNERLSDRLVGMIAGVLMLSACSGSGEPFQDSALLASQSDSIDEESEAENQLLAELNAEVTQLIELAGGAAGAEAFILPSSDDYDAIPQDPSNPLSAEKVELGQLLFHDTAFGNNGNNPDRSDTYSCASCHHAAAGFKAGIPQGIGEGGDGFGINGEARLLAPGFDAGLAADHAMKPDIQPLASPTILNSAYQEVMLWNGQFGNPIDGVINNSIDDAILSTAGTPKEANLQRFAGLETQALAGLGVHRMNVETDSLLQTSSVYREIYENAYGISSDVDQALENSAKSIAAFERTVLANEAPFQQWLRGDSTAMTVAELAGAKLFFGKANCTDCHRGPALSSEQGASAAQMFFSIGFGDFDTEDERIHGSVSDADSRGRGGFTGNPEDNFKFKIPQLYNLADTNVFGHGARLQSIREVVEYKNTAIPHASLNDEALSEYFLPLNLSDEEVGDLTEFLSSALYDANLERYVPNSVPSGQCIPVNDVIAREDLACE
ncbi:MAG: cytochrome-c peroxidase [Pseudomonadales bacterium]